MGYISGDTCDKILHISFTEKGMEYLSGLNPNKDGLEVKYFSLGDSDVNYNAYYRLCKIPDLTGEVDCIRETKAIAIKYPVTVSGGTNSSNILTDLNVLLNKICCE